MELTRRSFVQTAAAAATVAAAGSAVAGVARAGAGEQEAAALTADVVVVGSGNSGMCAAVEAAEAGASVVVLEREGNPGGTIYATEVMFGLGSQLQAQKGVELPYRYEVMNSELEYTNYRTDPLMWANFIDESGRDIDWLMDHGVPFVDVDDYRGIGDFPTAHWFEGNFGGAMAIAMAAKMEELGIQVLLQTKMTGLMVEDGMVTGVFAQDAQGADIQISAGAVVLATGGIGNDLALTQEKTGVDTSHAKAEFEIGNVGDGHKAVWSLGGKETPVCILPCMGVSGYDIRSSLAMAACIQPGLYINGDGRRFMAEDLHMRKLYALALNSQWSQPSSTYTFFDTNFIDMLENTAGTFVGNLEFMPGDLLAGLRDQLEEAALAEGYRVCFKGETLVDLAVEIGADPEILAQTIARYNELASKGVDEDFGKDGRFLFEISEEGPFYAVHTDLSVLTTIGGIGVDAKMRVVDGDNMPIPGLFSCGVASCPLYKETYNYQISGGMNAYCTYSGRVAGREAASL